VRRRTKNADTRRREALTAEGEPCSAAALRDSEPPRCYVDSLDAEGRKALSQKAAAKSKLVRQAKAEPKVRTGLDPNVSLLDIAAACAPALEAVYEHDGTPDWGARLAAAGTMLSCFPRQMRATPEHVRSLLNDFLPSRLIELRERANETNVYKAMREEFHRLVIRHHPIGGLYFDVPDFMIAPWEDRARVRADMPKPEGELERLPTGELLLRRDGKFPLLVPEDEAA